MIATRKKEIRREVLKKRDNLSLKERLERSGQICDNLMNLAEFQQARVVHFFLTTKSEVMTEEAIRRAQSLGKEVVVPVIDKGERRICLSKLEDYDQELTMMPHGIPEPKPEYNRCVPLSYVDLMILPGVAFDIQGHRLGYGAGYYDRMFRDEVERPLLVALAFEVQIVDDIPVGDHDVRVDKIITEKRIVECE